MILLKEFTLYSSSPLLQQPVNEPELSEGFKEMTIQHYFRNLQDIVNWPANVLLMHHDFTYHIYQELREFFLKEWIALSIEVREVTTCLKY